LPKAQYNLGVSYAIGNGLPQNYNEARAWFQKAAGKQQTIEKMSV